MTIGTTGVTTTFITKSDTQTGATVPVLPCDREMLLISQLVEAYQEMHFEVLQPLLGYQLSRLPMSY
jgi:hypothetical protein